MWSFYGNGCAKKIEGATALQRLRPLLLGRKVFEAFRLNPGERIDLVIFSGKRNLEASLWKGVHDCAKTRMPASYLAAMRLRLRCCGTFHRRLSAEDPGRPAQAIETQRDSSRKPGTRMRQASLFRALLVGEAVSARF